MHRRPFLRTLATGGVLLSAGCVESLPFTPTRLEADAVFADYRFEGTELVVEFRDGVDVDRAILSDSALDDPYETVDRPGSTARFQVVFPDRLETRISRSLHVTAETADGSARRRVGGPVHPYVTTVEPLSDGRARLEIENQTAVPLLVRFVAIYGDVPNPTVDPQGDSFDRSSFDLGPGVVGVAENQPLSPPRTDLVVPPEATKPFETTYAPFAFLDGAATADCDGTERTGSVAVVRGSGGSAAYSFSYRLEGEPAELQGQAAVVCPDLVGET